MDGIFTHGYAEVLKNIQGYCIYIYIRLDFFFEGNVLRYLFGKYQNNPQATVAFAQSGSARESVELEYASSIDVSYIFFVERSFAIMMMIGLKKLKTIGNMIIHVQDATC